MVRAVEISRGITARQALVVLSLAVCAAAAYSLRWRAERFRAPSLEVQLDIPPFPAEVARPLSFGFRSLVADLMFLEAIQLHGAKKPPRTADEGARDDRALDRLLTYATDLDPKFAGAYRFAGNSMPRHTTDGKVTNVLKAEAILNKGVRERPDDWRIPFTLGFLQSFYLGRFQEAARNLGLAARTPGSPAYLGLLATRAAAEGGDLDFGEQLARVMADQAGEESTRQEWQKRIADLRMERDVRAIDDAVARYRAQEGHAPSSLPALVRAGYLRSLPTEPHGGRYDLDERGEARSSAAQRLRISGRYGTTAGLEVK